MWLDMDLIVLVPEVIYLLFMDLSNYITCPWTSKYSKSTCLIKIYVLEENICCGYSLEALRGGAANKYPQYILS